MKVTLTFIVLVSAFISATYAAERKPEFPESWPETLVGHAFSKSSALSTKEKWSFAYSYARAYADFVLIGGRTHNRSTAPISNLAFRLALKDARADTLNLTPENFGYKRITVVGKFIREFEGSRFIPDGLEIKTARDYAKAWGYRYSPHFSGDEIQPGQTYKVDCWVSPTMQRRSGYSFGHMGLFVKEIVVLSVSELEI